MSDYNDFYGQADDLMYNPTVNQAFGYVGGGQRALWQFRRWATPAWWPNRC